MSMNLGMALVSAIGNLMGHVNGIRNDNQVTIIISDEISDELAEEIQSLINRSPFLKGFDLTFERGRTQAFRI